MQTTIEYGTGPVAVDAAALVAVSPMPRGTVRLHSQGFAGAWQALNGEVTIAHCIAMLDESGAVDNFRRLIGESDAEFRGPLFADSDVYKTLEAIAWELGRVESVEYSAVADDLIRLIGAAQTDDGYINTWVQGGMAGERFTDLRWSHELYCLGHLVQAAIAMRRATGRDDLLATAIRFVDLVDRELGAGGLDAVDGHPEIETALVELWRETREPRFLELARRFIELRGAKTVGVDRFGYEYFLDHLPVRDATEATGHAVRQLYLAAGATDLVIEEDDPQLIAALDRIWTSVHEEKIYITGGLGSRHRDESFGDPFELPPDRAYAETCAAIANLMWNWRMLLCTGEGRFADEMERGLYNVIAASTSISGAEFFYANPLQLRAGHRSEENAPAQRMPWYGCACCPPNLARLAASLDTYVATRNENGVQIHLYEAGELALGDESDSPRATISTGYPFDGTIAIDFDRAPVGELRLRIPGWVDGYTVELDGTAAQPEVESGYLVLAAGSVVETVRLRFDLEPEIVRPHPRIDAVRGTVAVRRGPVVYCLEQADLPEGVSVEDVVLPSHPQLRVAQHPDFELPAVVVGGATARGSAATPLYGATEHSESERPLGDLVLTPYFRWGNRRQTAMRVWIPLR